MEAPVELELPGIDGRKGNHSGERWPELLECQGVAPVCPQISIEIC